MNRFIIVFLLLIPGISKSQNLSFDGSNDYVTLASPMNLSGSNQASFSIWIKKNTGLPVSGNNANNESFLRQDINGVPDFWFGFSHQGNIVFGLRTASAYNALKVSSGSFSDWNTWVHVAATYDGFAKIKRLWLN